MKKNLFSKKIAYLYEQLNIGEDNFVKLFWNGKKPNFNTRKKSVIGKWYEGDIERPKAFYFDTYPISKLHKDGQLFFTKQNFLDDSFERFKRQVDLYIAHITRPKNLFEYKYIYYYDVHLKLVTFVSIYTIEEIDPSRYKIRIISSDLYKDQDLDPYYGELNIINDYYHISVKNSFERLSFYFILNKGFKNNSAIYGLRLGLSYDKGLPIAGKNLLSKKLLTPQEEQLFYLNANESDTLVSDESTQDIYSSTKENYLKKLHKKILDITTFMKKAREILHQSLDQDIYISLLHNGLSALNQISQKVYNNRTFYSYRRRSTRKIFLQKLALNPNASCAFVYPVFAKDSLLFEEEDHRSKEALHQIMDLAKSGLKIDMILIVPQEMVLNSYQKEVIEQLIQSSVELSISLLEEVQKGISSYDFLYDKTDKKVAIYRNIGDRICYFKVTNNRDSIHNLSYDFEKIKKESYSYEDFLQQKHIKIGTKLSHLIGTWYAYSYGSIMTDGQPKIWEVKYLIDQDRNIQAFYNDQLSYKGKLYLDDIKKSHIILTSIRSSNQSFITFQNKDIYKKIFKVSMIYNQFSTDLDMLTFGILSRIKLDSKTVRETLGKTEEITLKEGVNLEDRIKNLYLKHEL